MSLFRVPKTTEYALRSLCCLARSEDRLSVREIAARERIHPASLAKTLHMLCWQGLVHSKRGREGGFWLARDPNRIRLKEVVEIFQGPFDPAELPADQGFPAAWESLYAPTRQALEQLTLADLLRFQPGSDLQQPEAALGRRGRSSPKNHLGGDRTR